MYLQVNNELVYYYNYLTIIINYVLLY